MAFRDEKGIDLLSQAISDTEKEIFAGAFGKEEIVEDPTGDRTLEQMGDGLEGQHELDEDADGEEELDAEGEFEEDDAEGEQADGKGKSQETQPDPKTARTGQQPEGRVPPGRFREVSERARAAETERDLLKAQSAEREAKYQSELAATNAKIDGLMQLLARQNQQQQPTAKAEVKADEPPDIFEDPKGYADYLARQQTAALSQRDRQIADLNANFSFQLAHVKHGDNFTKAWSAVTSLSKQDPEAQSTVSRIMSSANPGEALMQWYQRNEVMRQIGDKGLDGYKTQIAEETRKALMDDPEFRQQLLEELRAEATTGNNGRARNQFRLPKSLNGAAGQSGRGDGSPFSDPGDGSDQAVFESAWRS